MSAWGWHFVSGVEFFLEPGKVPPLCPVDVPSCECPHKTSGMPRKLDFRCDRVYLSGVRPSVENVEWYDDVFYYGTKSFKQIEERCTTTQGYVPLVVHNLRLFDKTEDVFRRALAVASSSMRPIVVVSEDSDWIVAPSFVERI